MHEIKAIIRRDRLESVLEALRQIADVPGITVSTVTGFGKRQPDAAGGAMEFGEVTMTKLEVVVPDGMLSEALASIRRAAFTGHAGDGKVFVLPVEQALKIRSDEQGLDAL
ncbi:MAG: P-II family nitrogen regulator [Vicinamibacterales bacterium]|nr:P-II family nitrogen regulator [Vicinamibacterales bacterium]